MDLCLRGLIGVPRLGEGGSFGALEFTWSSKAPKIMDFAQNHGYVVRHVGYFEGPMYACAT